MPQTHRVTAGTTVSLSQTSSRGRDYCDDRDSAEDEFRELRDQFIDQQARLYAEGQQKLLIVLQAMDAGGKDGTIRRICQGVNPQGVRVTSFKKPSSEDLAHDFLWRIHRAVPAKGMIGIFNRSHYEDVLAVRVHNIVPESVWRPRYRLINQFEQHLTVSGTTVLKFYLHISRDEQKSRFQDRLDNPDKHWKFDVEDLHKRALWDDYQQAFEDMLTHCTTEAAPWYVIPADQKWYRNLAIMRVINDTLQTMAPQYPGSDDLSGIVID